jgi:hypothetical protein
LGAVRDPRPAPPLRGWPGWMTGLELRRFAVRRVTVHASPPRRAAYCVPHLDGTSRGGSKARATPRFLGAARAMSDGSLRSPGSRPEAAAFLSPSRTNSVSARSFVQDSGARSRPLESAAAVVVARRGRTPPLTPPPCARDYRRSQLFSPDGNLALGNSSADSWCRRHLSLQTDGPTKTIRICCPGTAWAA